jgi:glycerate dehydrogenase
MVLLVGHALPQVEGLPLMRSGKYVESMGKALGMKVLVAERKGATEVRQGRVPFDEGVQEGTVFIIVAPGDDSTRGMFSKTEFETMDSSALVVNVGRGGVVSETEVAAALKAGTIGGYGTDVFEKEPATLETCPLLDPSVPNIIHTPHLVCKQSSSTETSDADCFQQAWYSAKTIRGTIETVQANIEAFVAGKPQNLI